MGIKMGRPPCCDKSNVKRGLWTAEEDAKILAYISTHGTGNWTSVPKKADQLPGRTDNDVKNHWNTKLRKKLFEKGIDPITHKPMSQIAAYYQSIGFSKSTKSPPPPPPPPTALPKAHPNQ
ncbi:Protein ODORANT1 [Acorus calamus]|uniref:Protein ODORANT1 n=1 Tax=Acorus calamus TaxID=4465 RepID=A0AAV9BYZ1_ACOCL|nr:Protein ODORANT1 [Acorus calamus]